MIFGVVGLFLFVIYSGWLIWTIRGLHRLKPLPPTWEPTIAIIVPIRNEEAHILPCIQSLFAQNYPADKFAIWVIDDGSTDRSIELLQRQFAAEPRLHLIQIKQTVPAPKKAAIAIGIGASTGELIVTTDGDCQAPRNWLRHLTASFTPTTAMVAGWVKIVPGPDARLFHRVQALEFSSLVSAGAGAIGMNRPLLANGANLCYRRAVFTEIQGFGAQAQIASGDDVLLMRKMHRLGWHIGFAVHPEAVVTTVPVQNWSEFYQQRKRWASKGLAYDNWRISALLAAIYLFYLYLVLALPLTLGQPQWAGLILAILVLKTALDFWLLRHSSRITGQNNLLKYIPLAELFQIFYVIIVSLTAITQSYRWKGRQFGANATCQPGD